MRVIIPAAGLGSRLGPLTDEIAKAVVNIAGEPLLWHTLAQLRDAGASDVVVVSGHRSGHLQSTLQKCPKRPPLTFVNNANYKTTDSMFSLWLTRRWWDQPFCVVDGDLLVSSALLQRVFHTDGDRLVVDMNRNYSDIEMHAKVDDGSVTRIGNDLTTGDSSGEFFGVSRWTPEGASHIAAEVSRRLSAGEATQRYAEAIGNVVLQRPIRTIEAKEYEWAEVDSPDDVPRADRLIREWRSSN